MLQSRLTLLKKSLVFTVTITLIFILQLLHSTLFVQRQKRQLKTELRIFLFTVIRFTNYILMYGSITMNTKHWVWILKKISNFKVLQILILKQSANQLFLHNFVRLRQILISVLILVCLKSAELLMVLNLTDFATRERNFALHFTVKQNLLNHFMLNLQQCFQLLLTTSSTRHSHSLQWKQHSATNTQETLTQFLVTV